MSAESESFAPVTPSEPDDFSCDMGHVPNADRSDRLIICQLHEVWNLAELFHSDGFAEIEQEHYEQMEYFLSLIAKLII